MSQLSGVGENPSWTTSLRADEAEAVAVEDRDVRLEWPAATAGVLCELATLRVAWCRPVSATAFAWILPDLGNGHGCTRFPLNRSKSSVGCPISRLDHTISVRFPDAALPLNAGISTRTQSASAVS